MDHNWASAYKNAAYKKLHTTYFQVISRANHIIMENIDFGRSG